MSEEQIFKLELVFFLRLDLVSLPLVFIFVVVDDWYSLLYGKGMMTKDRLKAGLINRILLFLGRLGAGRDGE